MELARSPIEFNTIVMIHITENDHQITSVNRIIDKVDGSTDERDTEPN